MPKLVALVIAALIPLVATASPSNAETQRHCRQNTEKRAYPNIGARLFIQKLFDCKTGTITIRAVDTVTGDAVDPAKVLAAEVQARLRNPHAKLDPLLVDVLRKDPKAFHSVVVWLDFEDAKLDAYAEERLAPLVTPLGKPVRFDEVDALAVRTEIIEYNRARIAELTNPLAKLLGNRVRYVSTTAPLLVSKSTLKKPLLSPDCPKRTQRIFR